MGYLKHIALDGPLGRQFLHFRRSIPGKEKTVAITAHTYDGRVLVSCSSFLFQLRCFYDFYYTLFFA